MWTICLHQESFSLSLLQQMHPPSLPCRTPPVGRSSRMPLVLSHLLATPPTHTTLTVCGWSMDHQDIGWGSLLSLWESSIGEHTNSKSCTIGKVKHNYWLLAFIEIYFVDILACIGRFYASVVLETVFLLTFYVQLIDLSIHPYQARYLILFKMNCFHFVQSSLREGLHHSWDILWGEHCCQKVWPLLQPSFLVA